MKAIMKRSFAFALMLVFTAVSAWAQIGSQGQIQGFVRDQAGAAIGNATVVVTDTGTGQQRSVQADSEGYYVIANIPAGFYEVSVEQPGFKKSVQTNVKLDAAARQSVDISLEIGNVAETVTITESVAPQIQSSTAQVGRLLEGTQVQELSLNGRNPIFLGMLKAGVLGSNPNGFNFTPSNGGLNVNGSRSNENSILLDGVQQLRTRASGTTTGVINVDTVQEVQILTSNYAAEFGRATGGQFAFVTKPGTQEFHGTVSYFLRNSALDANEWNRNRTPLTTTNRIAEKPPVLKFNQPGYSVGGPIYIPGTFNESKEKLFFFFAQEWSYRRNESTPRIVVPSVALRSGDVREFGAGADGQFGTADDPVRDPLSGAGFIDPTRGAGFIPMSRMSPVGRAIVNAYPLPNASFANERTNLVLTGSNAEDTRKDVLRLDYYQGIHHLSFRGSLFAWKIQNAFRGDLPFAPDNNDRPNRSAGLTLVSTLTPTLINEFTFGAAADIVKLAIGGDPSRLDKGINYPYIFPGTKEIEDKIPTIAISDYQTIDGGPYPAFSSGPIYTFTDTLTHVRGSHTIKGGINIERSGQNDFDQINIQNVPGSTNNQNGRFEFTRDRPGGTGQGVTDALLGLFRNYGEIGQKNYTPWRGTAFEFFVQDNWKARQNLTLEYGVRYNYWPPWYSLWNNVATFRPEFYQRGLLSLDSRGAVVVNPGADFTTARYNGIALPGSGFPDEAIGRVFASGDPRNDVLFRGIPRGLSETHKNVFEPRLGIAYAPDEKSTLRAGFAVFHNRVTLNDSSLLGGNAPLQFLVGVENGSADAPAGVVTSFADSIRFPFNLTMQDPVFKHPTAYNWSLTAQRELPGKIAVEIGYVGKRTLYLQRERNINSLLPGQNFVRNAAGQVTGLQPLANALRPYLGHGQIRLAENSGNSIYHSGQLSVNRRFANGFSFDVAYTFSKSIDNASGLRDVLPNAYDDRNIRGVSSFDRPHAFVVNYIYELPIGKGKRFLNRGGVLNALLGGYQVTGISFIRSGGPFSVGIPIDALGVGPGSGNENTIQTASLLRPVRQLTPRLGGQFFDDPTAFTLPAPGTEGTSGRNAFRDPYFQNHDLAVFKNFAITEGTRLQFRVEMFNFINHPILSRPDMNLANGGIVTSFASFTNPSSATYGSFNSLTAAEQAAGTGATRNFGLYTSKTGDRRQIQLALKLVF